MLYYYDPMYFVILIAALLSMAASFKVKSTFNKYSRVRSNSGMTGEEAAVRILRSQGIYDVTVEPIRGNLTDHYDPRAKVLRLSESVYRSPSVAAIAVAAHECGHAVQDSKAYMPLKLRAALVPVANIGSRLAIPLIFLGFLFNGGSSSIFIQIGIIMFSAAVLFQLVTLPVEFNASSRAAVLLEDNGILYGDEINQTKKVLSAAALTYVASAAVAVLQLLRLIALFGGRNRD